MPASHRLSTGLCVVNAEDRLSLLSLLTLLHAVHCTGTWTWLMQRQGNLLVNLMACGLTSVSARVYERAYIFGENTYTIRLHVEKTGKPGDFPQGNRSSPQI